MSWMKRAFVPFFVMTALLKMGCDAPKTEDAAGSEPNSDGDTDADTDTTSDQVTDTGTECTGEAVFADPGLDTYVRAAIGADPGETVYFSDLQGLTALSAPEANITDIEGIQCLSALRFLDLSWNGIRDISPLSGLTELTDLDLHMNESLSDISPLSALTGLTYLQIGIINTDDISPLSNLTALTFLDLTNNDLDDISVLSGLTKLTCLALGFNNISDISPLVENVGIADGAQLLIVDNLLDCENADTISDIQTIVDRGAAVWDDCVNPDGWGSDLDADIAACYF